MRVLLGHRTAEPVPLFWLGATGVGVLLGIATRLVFGWWWWLMAVGWLAMVWSVFLATAFRPPGRDDLWIDVVGTVSPRQAERLEGKRLVRLADAAPGPVYGLAGWTGPRALQGYGRSSSAGLTHLGLLYGEPPERPYLRVDTVWKERDRHGGDPETLRRDLTRELWHRQLRPPEGLTPRQLNQWAAQRERQLDQRPMPKWDWTEFLVEGTPRAFEILVEADDWAAFGNIDDVVVRLEAQRFPAKQVALTQVPDVTPYVDGSLQLRDQPPQRRRST